MYQFKKEQFIHTDIDTLWDFISSPANLQKITPAYMGFDILSKELAPEMYKGMIISYRVRPLAGIPMSWVTEITQVEDKKYFIDEQRFGPYAFWHHQHHLKQVEGGILMTDILHYKPPFGLIGKLANRLIIRRKLNEIFNFRKEKLMEIFPDKAP